MRKLKKILTVIGMVGLITSIGLIYSGCAQDKQAEEEVKKETQVESVQDTTVQDTTAVEATE